MSRIILCLVFIFSIISPALCDADVSLIDSAKTLNNKGVYYYRIGDYINAEKFYRSSLELKKIVFENNPNISIANSYNNLGLLNSLKWKYDSALSLYSKAGRIYSSFKGMEIRLANLNSNIGLLYYLQGDFTLAEQYYNKAINQLYELHTPEADLRRTEVYNRLGIILAESSRYNEAIKYYEKGIEAYNLSNDKTTLQHLHTNLANALVKVKQYNKAEAEYNRALNTINSSSIITIDKKAWTLQHISYLNALNGEREKALDNLNKANSIFSKLSIDPTQLQKCYNYNGQTYLSLEMYDSAIYYFQLALYLSCENEFHSIYDSPNISQLKNTFKSISLLKAKSECLLKWYETKPQEKTLKSSLESLKLAAKLIGIARNSYISIESKLILAKNESSIYEMGIYCAYLLYQHSNDDNYIKDAFYFAEKSKSSVLISVLQDEKAKAFSNIPQKLLSKEQDLKKEVTFYKERIYEESLKLTPDNNKIKLWENYLFNFIEEQVALKTLLEKDYPEYYNLKYNHNSPNIKDIQKLLNKKTSILEYSLMGQNLYVFNIEKSGTNFHKIEVDSSFHENILKHLNQFRDFSFTNQSQEQLLSINEQSFNLFETILEPFISKNRIKELIIIPDDVLSYLPFETLLTQNNNISKNYSNAPYLLNKYAITYSYSSSLLLESWRGNNRKLFNKVLSVAPKYEPTNTSEILSTRSGHTEYRNSLHSLPFAKREAKLIGQLTKGKTILAQDATEENFVAEASNFDVLHLAMHTIIDDNNPLYSMLVFYDKNYQSNNGLLTTNEIFSLKLNASMTVLSSCSTGEGEYQKGEGVLSLARGFFYAGCPSLVMTLWQIEDESGLKLMNYYYRYLIKGYSKPRALQKAKLEYLKNVPNEKKHPFYWSAYICIGNPSPIYYSKLLLASISVCSIGFCFILIAVFRRLKRGKLTPPAL